MITMTIKETKEQVFSDKGKSKNTKEIGAVTGLEALNLTAVVKLSLTGDG